MANETEIERLVVRLVGDTDQYAKSMDKAAETTTAKTDSIVKDIKKVQDAQNRAFTDRPNKELEDFFNSVRNPPAQDVNKLIKPTEALQAKIDAAVDRTNAEKRRILQEEDRIITRRMRATREEHDQTFANQTQHNIPDPFTNKVGRGGGGGGGGAGGGRFGHGATAALGFRESVAAAGSYVSALAGLAIVELAVQTGENAMAVAMEQLNLQLARGTELTRKMIEARNYQAEQANKLEESLPIADRRIAKEQRLLQVQKDLAEQSEAARNAREADEKGREGFVEKELKQIPLFGGIARAGYADREQPREERKRDFEDTKMVAERTKSEAERLQRDIANASIGGPNSQIALNMFKERMEGMTEAIGKGRKALLLYHILHEQAFDSSQKAKVEHYFEEFHRGQEKLQAAEDVTERYFDALIHNLDEFSSPMDKFAEEVAELNKVALPNDVYARALDHIKQKYDQATGAARKFHQEVRGNSVAAGSQEAILKAFNQDLSINQRVAASATNPQGLNDPEIRRLLQSIDSKTVKPNDLKTTPVLPANVGDH